MSLNLFSQKTILSENGDTTICFNTNQSRYLLKKLYALEECDSLLGISETQLTYCDSIKKSNDKIQKAFLEVADKQKDIEAALKFQIVNLKNEVQENLTKINIEKNKKRLWIGLTGLVSSVFCYYVLIK